MYQQLAVFDAWMPQRSQVTWRVSIIGSRPLLQNLSNGSWLITRFEKRIWMTLLAPNPPHNFCFCRLHFVPQSDWYWARVWAALRMNSPSPRAFPMETFLLSLDRPRLVTLGRW